MSILVNPLMFFVIDKLSGPREAAVPMIVAPAKELPPATEEKPTTLTGHAVLVGHGRVGSHVPLRSWPDTYRFWLSRRTVPR